VRALLDPIHSQILGVARAGDRRRVVEDPLAAHLWSAGAPAAAVAPPGCHRRGVSVGGSWQAARSPPTGVVVEAAVRVMVLGFRGVGWLPLSVAIERRSRGGSRPTVVAVQPAPRARLDTQWAVVDGRRREKQESGKRGGGWVDRPCSGGSRQLELCMRGWWGRRRNKKQGSRGDGGSPFAWLQLPVVGNNPRSAGRLSTRGSLRYPRVVHVRQIKLFRKQDTKNGQKASETSISNYSLKTRWIQTKFKL
jgi:hypothetical protein